MAASTIRGTHDAAFTLEPLSAANLRDIARLWPDRLAFTAAEFDRVLAVAARLLATGRAHGTVVRVNEQACAAGMSIFVRETFASEYLETPHHQLGKQLLMNANDAILDLPAIAAGNATTGLQLAIVMTHIDPDVEDRSSALGLLMQAFLQTHTGFRIARVIGEIFGAANIADIRTAGAFEVRSEIPSDPARATPPSVVIALSREGAIAQRSLLLPLFLYNSPRMFFTRGERDLLSAALDGDTDDGLADRLGVSVSAVKARWSRIQQRAALRHPDLFAHVASASADRGRGPQVRHLILRYVRANPSELTPCTPQEHLRAIRSTRSAKAVDQENG